MERFLKDDPAVGFMCNMAMHFLNLCQTDSGKGYSSDEPFRTALNWDAADVKEETKITKDGKILGGVEYGDLPGTTNTRGIEAEYKKLPRFFKMRWTVMKIAALKGMTERGPCAFFSGSLPLRKTDLASALEHRNRRSPSTCSGHKVGYIDTLPTRGMLVAL